MIHGEKDDTGTCQCLRNDESWNTRKSSTSSLNPAVEYPEKIHRRVVSTKVAKTIIEIPDLADAFACLADAVTGAYAELVSYIMTMSRITHDLGLH